MELHIKEESNKTKITKNQFLRNITNDINRCCGNNKNSTRLIDTVYIKFPNTNYWEEWRYDFYFNVEDRTIKGKISLFTHEKDGKVNMIKYDYDADKFGWVDWTPSYGNKAFQSIRTFFDREIGKFC